MRSPEQVLQRAVVEYLTLVLWPPTWFTTIPAGGGGELRGKILKGLGYRAGCPDMMIVSNGRVYFIELKSAKGQLSPAQQRTGTAILMAGSSVAVVRSLDEVRRLFSPHGPWAAIPTRETRALEDN